jgi:putative hydrolase of HD superfamily
LGLYLYKASDRVKQFDVWRGAVQGFARNGSPEDIGRDTAWSPFGKEKVKNRMNRVADFLFEAMHLKRIHRTGFQFLGPGKESVAEHTFAVMFVAWAMARLTPEVNPEHLLAMCLVHDLPEARMGDLNYVQKRYVDAKEASAINEMMRDLPFGMEIKELIDEFNDGETIEAQLANDADQLAFLLELKSLSDMGYTTPAKWERHVKARLITPSGKKLAETISRTEWDAWWLKIFIDSNGNLQ